MGKHGSMSEHTKGLYQYIYTYIYIYISLLGQTSTSGTVRHFELRLQLDFQIKSCNDFVLGREKIKTNAAFINDVFQIIPNCEPDSDDVESHEEKRFRASKLKYNWLEGQYESLHGVSEHCQVPSDTFSHTRFRNYDPNTIVHMNTKKRSVNPGDGEEKGVGGGRMEKWRFLRNGI